MYRFLSKNKMRKFLLFLLVAGTSVSMSCGSEKLNEAGSATQISVEEMEKSSSATDQAETTTANIDSTAIILADTTASN